METIEANSLCAQRRPVIRFRAGQWQEVQDDLAEEVPVALKYNGISHAVMLATPAALEEFALGFSLCEGIRGSAEDCYDIDAERGEAGITLRIRISSAAFMMQKDRRRTLAGRTGCGLCGTESLRQVLRHDPGRIRARQCIRRLCQLRTPQTGLKKMDIRNLVKMANQIGDYFSSFPDREDALREIAGHLQKFWAPRMRCQLLEHIDRHHGEGLQDMVLTSINMHRAKLEPKA